MIRASDVPALMDGNVQYKQAQSNSQSNPVYAGENGTIVLQAESSEPSGSWVETTVDGRTVMLWDAPQSNYRKVDPNEALSYKFIADEAGTYYIGMHSGRVKSVMGQSELFDSDGKARTDTGNDAFVSVVEVATGNVIQAPIKLFTGLGGSDEDLRFGDTFDANHKFSDATVTLQPGVEYELIITGRSDGYALDMITLNKGSVLKDADAPQSALADGSVQPVEPDPDNQAPVAVDDTAQTEHDQTILVDVLQNDSDPDGDTLTLTDVSYTGDTSVVTIKNGGIEVNPLSAATEARTEVITYTVADSDGATSTATLSVDVAPSYEGEIVGNDNNNTLKGTPGDDVLRGFGGKDVLIGYGGNDTLQGGKGSDTLDGRDGSDTMYGGWGHDTFIVDNANDRVIEYSNNGTDTVEASVTYRLWQQGDFIEGLTLTGKDDIDGYGNSADNTLIGNSGSNFLSGGFGADALDGGRGADAMAGGAGNDTYVVDDAGDSVIELAGEGTDTVDASVTYRLWQQGNFIEDLTLTGTRDIDGYGNGESNTLIGNSGSNFLSGGGGADTLNGGLGADRLDGGSGADAMAGGAGDDTYVVDHFRDSVIELAGEGTDTVEASVTFRLWQHGSSIEDLTLAGTDNIDAYGNGENNTLIGNSGDNILSGGYGADTLNGGSGADLFVLHANHGPSDADTITDFATSDSLRIDGATGKAIAFTQVGSDTRITADGNIVATVLDAAASEVEARASFDGAATSASGSTLASASVASTTVPYLGGNATNPSPSADGGMVAGMDRDAAFDFTNLAVAAQAEPFTMQSAMRAAFSDLFADELTGPGAPDLMVEGDVWHAADPDALLWMRNTAFEIDVLI